MKKNSHQHNKNSVKHILVVSLILLSFLFSTNNIFAQVEDAVPVWKKAHYLSEEEMLNKDWVDRDFYPTDPPEGPVCNVAEFAQMEGVLIRYPFGIPVSLIAEMSEDVMVTTIVMNSSQENTVTNIYQSGGVNLSNCNFLHAPSDSYWTRDYGPWYVIDENYEIGIVNFPYNRPRPGDNDIPIKMAEFLDINLFGMNVFHTGGNYMTDGLGNSSSTTLVWDENPGVSHEEIDQYLEDYLGITTYHVLPDPLGEYIEHIDCWGKFLDVNKVLIGQVPENDPRYDDFEYVADYFASQLSGWGMPYEVYRVFTPGTSPQTPYTNSLILNNKILVPITGSQWDDEAIVAYEEAMPGYEILGIYSSGGPGWQNTDALHCRAKGVADRGMLWVKHMPLWGNISEQTDYIIEATIVPLSGAALYPDSVLVYYKVDEGSYASVQMTTQDDTTYIGLIPGAEPGSEIAYYIYAADESGRNANHPFIGAPDPHTFIVEPLADVTVVPDSMLFLDYQQCVEGQPVMVYNLTDTEVTINDITPEGWEFFYWYIDPWGITLPYALPPGDSLELVVKIGIPVATMGVLLCDTLFIETEASTHKVAIKVDSDLVSITDPDHSASLNLTNYPNPFSGSTTIAFEVEEPSKVALEIFNYQGQLINTLLNEDLPQGLHSVLWNGTGYNGDAVSSGIYIYRLSIGKTVSMKKMLLMK